MEKKHTARGRIVSVEEDRFRLMTDSGDALLLTLAKFARVSPDDLKDWHRSNAHVTVTYEGSPNLASGVAHSAGPVPDGDNQEVLA